MRVFRLAREKYCRDLSGKGSELAGGRWNTAGIKMLYTCSSRALCVVEILVHIHADIIPYDYMMLTLEIPDTVSVPELKINSLNEKWRKMPWSNQTQQVGNDFILKNKSAVLKVPSAVVDGDYNFLFNPGHKDFSKLKIVSVESFEFDSRLFKIGNL